MDRERDLDLDTFLMNASRSALESLDAVIDVEQRLRDLYRDVGQSKTPADGIIRDGAAEDATEPGAPLTLDAVARWSA